MTRGATVRDLLDRADDAAALCRAEDDLDGWTTAVLGAASVYLFGAEPGKLPAQLL